MWDEVANSRQSGKTTLALKMLQEACNELTKAGFSLPIKVYMHSKTKEKLWNSTYAFNSFIIITSDKIPIGLVLRSLSVEDRRIYGL